MYTTADAVEPSSLLLHRINPHVTNGLYHRFHLAKSTLEASEVSFPFLLHFSMKIMSANRIAPAGTPRS